MRKSEDTRAVDPRSEYSSAGMVGATLGIEGRRLRTEEHGSKGTGDVGGREGYAIWCNGRDLDRAVCKSEVAPWLAVRSFEGTVVHRAWAASSVGWVGTELGANRQGRMEAGDGR
jgi:hypothetical protein